jgi:hypothetical protein
VQVAGAVPVLLFADKIGKPSGAVPEWIAVAIGPLASLALLLVVGRMLASIVLATLARPPLGALGSAASVAVPTTPRS